MSKKVLFINPRLSFGIYKNTRLDSAVSQIPLLSLASLSGVLVREGHRAEILDLVISDTPKRDLSAKLSEFSPDYVGVTFCTPAYNEVKEIAKMVKDFNQDIILIAGGPHISALPEDTLNDIPLDIAVFGEGEETLKEIVNGNVWERIDGICFKKNGVLRKNESRRLISDLDCLPLPDWTGFNIQKYKTSPLTSKISPVGPLETSRGCIYRCSFCSKNIFGYKVRTKSINRVMDEIESMLKRGFKEIRIWDENFTFQKERVLEICEQIRKRNFRFPWNLPIGVRADNIDRELLKTIVKAGCYLISFGIESGNQKILDGVAKGITLEQCRRAVRLAKESGLEVNCFFMFGLPGETEETLKDTIKFAIELNPNYAHAGIMVPFPSTDIFSQIERGKRIKTYDWSAYNFHTTRNIYQHENLTWDIIFKYYNLFYRRFYLFRLNHIIVNRFRKNMFKRKLLFDLSRYRKFILHIIRFFSDTSLKRKG